VRKRKSERVRKRKSERVRENTNKRPSAASGLKLLKCTIICSESNMLW